MKITRRMVLKGLGGVALGLPVLESLLPKNAHAAPGDHRFVIFFRQANGVAQGTNGETDRFWPRTLGALTTASMTGRAVDELDAFRSKLLILRNVNMRDFNYGDGHARGAMQGLTARGPVVAAVGGDSEAAGESLDHRIGRELNPGGRDSMVIFVGRGGWLGNQCISYRASNQRRSGVSSPWLSYTNMVGGAGGMTEEAQIQLATRKRSVNDLVRSQLQSVMAGPRLSTSDRQRLQLHLDSVRTVEVALACRLEEDAEMLLQTGSTGHDSTDGDLVLGSARLHMQVAALAVACGHTRAVTIQVGSGNDGATRYRNLDDGSLMENYHYLSHRQLSHGSDGAPIANADVLHHHVDRHFARTFRHLLTQLDAYVMPDAKTLLQHGMAIWYNDNADGPPHGARSVPWIIAGGANGRIKQGEYLEVTPGSNATNHNRLLNTLGTVMGLTNGAGGPLTDFGDPILTPGLLPEITVT